MFVFNAEDAEMHRVIGSPEGRSPGSLLCVTPRLCVEDETGLP